MPSEKPLGRLEDVFDNIDRIQRFTAGMDFAAFNANEQAFYATLHALLIVSEAARKLGDEANTLVPGQPWANIPSVGNVLRHERRAMNMTVLILKPSDGLSAAVVWLP